jgi:hypothetical protein
MELPGNKAGAAKIVTVGLLIPLLAYANGNSTFFLILITRIKDTGRLSTLLTCALPRYPRASLDETIALGRQHSDTRLCG